MPDERSHIEDQLLVMDAQDGDRRAMAQLVSRWQRPLWRHAYRLTGQVEAAWDVTQQGWLAIIRHLGRLQDPASFRPWAYRIVSHKAADWVRRQRRMRNTMSIDDAGFVSRASTAGTGASLRPWSEGVASSTPAGDNTLAEALRRLDIAKRTILSLYYFERLSITEVAAALRIPAGTVKSRLSTARNALRQLLEDPKGDQS